MKFITGVGEIMVDLTEKKTGKTTSPNCPNCGQFMDKIVAWVCPKCGKIKKNSLGDKKTCMKQY